MDALTFRGGGIREIAPEIIGDRFKFQAFNEYRGKLMLSNESLLLV